VFGCIIIKGIGELTLPLSSTTSRDIISPLSPSPPHPRVVVVVVVVVAAAAAASLCCRLSINSAQLLRLTLLHAISL